MAQLCATHPAFKAPGLAAGRLSINEQAKPFGMAERGGTILRFQLSKGLGHTVELQGFELIQCWVSKHILSSSMKVPGATDVGLSDRRTVRGGRAALAVKTIFQNGIQRCE